MMKLYIQQGSKMSFETAYDAGFDCGLNGANNLNSHFKWFATKESMQQWEQGKKNAIEKNKSK